MADDDKKPARNENPDVPNVGSPQPIEVKGATKNAGQPLAEGEASKDASQPEPIENYSLKKVEDEDLVLPGLVELEVVAEGTFVSSTGDVLKTGDRKLVSNEDAATLLDVKTNGSAAFKKV